MEDLIDNEVYSYLLDMQKMIFEISEKVKCEIIYRNSLSLEIHEEDSKKFKELTAFLITEFVCEIYGNIWSCYIRDYKRKEIERVLFLKELFNKL